MITAKKPKKVLVFDNTGLGTLPAPILVGVAVRHAADIGPVTFKVDTDEIEKNPLPPTSTAADPVYLKGDQHANPLSAAAADFVWTTWVTRPGSDTLIFGPHFLYIEGVRSRRYEFILVGTKIHNLKLVTARRLVTIVP